MDMTFPFHVVVLIAFGSVGAVSNVTEYIRHSIFMDKPCENSLIVFEEPSRSNIECTALCQFTQGCNSVILYDTDNKGCFGLKGYLACVGQTTSLQGAGFYKKPRVAECGHIVNLVSGPYGVANSQITASSSYSTNHLPEYGRLDFNKTWGPAAPGGNLQVDFLIARNITGIITQGSCCDYNWVKTYTFKYSLDCISFTAVIDSAGNDKVFQGNYDASTHVTQILTTAVVGRCVRLYPKTWYIWPDLRLEVLGCEIPTTTD